MKESRDGDEWYLHTCLHLFKKRRGKKDAEKEADRFYDNNGIYTGDGAGHFPPEKEQIVGCSDHGLFRVHFPFCKRCSRRCRYIFLSLFFLGRPQAASIVVTHALLLGDVEGSRRAAVLQPILVILYGTIGLLEHAINVFAREEGHHEAPPRVVFAEEGRLAVAVQRPGEEQEQSAD